MQEAVEEAVQEVMRNRTAELCHLTIPDTYMNGIAASAVDKFTDIAGSSVVTSLSRTRPTFCWSEHRILLTGRCCHRKLDLRTSACLNMSILEDTPVEKLVSGAITATTELVKEKLGLGLADQTQHTEPPGKPSQSITHCLRLYTIQLVEHYNTVLVIQTYSTQVLSLSTPCMYVCAEPEDPGGQVMLRAGDALCAACQSILHC